MPLSCFQRAPDPRRTGGLFERIASYEVGQVFGDGLGFDLENDIRLKVWRGV